MKKTFIGNPFNQYLLFWILYTLQGTGYYNLGLLSALLHALVLVYTFYYVYYANRYYVLPSFLKAVNAILVFVGIYTLIRLTNTTPIIDNIGYEVIPTSTFRSLYPLFASYAFFVMTKQGLVTERALRIWVIVFLGAALLYIYGMKVSYSERIDSTEIGYFTNNAGYIVLSILPSIFLFYRKPFVQYLLIIFILYFVITSMKRGAIITGFLCLLFFLFRNRKTMGKKSWYIFILSILLIFGLFYFIRNEVSSNDYFNYRINQTLEGDYSNRETLYGELLDLFVHSSFIEQLLGHGLDGTVQAIGIMAHSDWIEFIFNMGVLGLFLLLYFYKSMISSLKAMKNSPMVFSIFGMSLILIFTKSLFSMSITSLLVYQTCLVGFCLAKTETTAINIEYE